MHSPLVTIIRQYSTLFVLKEKETNAFTLGTYVWSTFIFCEKRVFLSDYYIVIHIKVYN